MTGVLRWLYLFLTEKLYKEWATLYDPVSFLVSLGQWSRWRLSAKDYVAGEQVLELGFGTGHLLSAIAESGVRITGVDSSPAMVARTAHRLRCDYEAVDIVQGRAEYLPFSDASFNTVVSTFPAAYVLDESTLQECERVLHTGNSDQNCGRLVVVGLWVNTDCPVLRGVFSPFYGSPNWSVIGHYMEAMRNAGFSPAVVENQFGEFRVGTVIAIKHI